MNEKNIYLRLFPNTFLWMNNQIGIMYESFHQKIFRFNITDLIAKYCQQLQDLHNLYTIQISNEDLQNIEFHKWIDTVVNKEMGELLYIANDAIYPISFPPLLNLQSDIERIDAEKSRNIGEFAAQNWNEFTIFLADNSKYPDLYKQILYPINSQKTLNFESLQTFLSSADNNYLHTINIVGDIFKYSHKEKLLAFLSKQIAKINIYLTANILFNNLNKLQLFPSNIHFYVYYEKNYYHRINEIIFSNNYDLHWLYLLQSDTQYDEFIQLQESNMGKKIIAVPIYNEKNLSFFEKYIYITENDFDNLVYKKKDIFSHQVLNTNFWGKLSLLPNGNIYSNFNHPPIGNIKNDKLYSLIVAEMRSKKTWRWTRDYIHECKDCIYKYLCPSPSNYELVIGKNNLCHLKR